MDGGDARMVERGQDLGFKLEPRQPVGVVCEGVRQNLQGHIAAELGIGGAIHLAHAAFADLGGDGIRAEGGA